MFKVQWAKFAHCIFLFGCDMFIFAYRNLHAIKLHKQKGIY